MSKGGQMEEIKRKKRKKVEKEKIEKVKKVETKEIVEIKMEMKPVEEKKIKVEVKKPVEKPKPVEKKPEKFVATYIGPQNNIKLSPRIGRIIRGVPFKVDKNMAQTLQLDSNFKVERV